MNVKQDYRRVLYELKDSEFAIYNFFNDNFVCNQLIHNTYFSLTPISESHNAIVLLQLELLFVRKKCSWCVLIWGDTYHWITVKKHNNNYLICFSFYCKKS